MDAIGQGTAPKNAPGDTGARPGRPSPRRWGRGLLLIVVLAAWAFGAGFLWFVNLTEASDGTPPRNADGIVALTGGPFRINDALELLAAGRAQRLLITGVNPITRPVEISRLVPEHQRWFNCCVDIDHSANTIGNAVETRRWVKSRGFKSVIVVTANYHMPRAMAELAHELPDVTLLPYPVVSEKMRTEPWWENPETVRLLLWEYLKFLVAKVRMWVPWSFE
jgi:uncharacterized SAM-binding protein YcdF (DUF218 family)